MLCSYNFLLSAYSARCFLRFLFTSSIASPNHSIRAQRCTHSTSPRIFVFHFRFARTSIWRVIADTTHDRVYVLYVLCIASVACNIKMKSMGHFVFQPPLRSFLAVTSTVVVVVVAKAAVVVIKILYLFYQQKHLLGFYLTTQTYYRNNFC